MDHQRKPWAHAEPSRHARGYGSEWGAKRRQVLAEEPVCRYCRRAASTTADHIKPKAEGGTDDRRNLAGCCKACQQAKAGREGARARARRTEGVAEKRA